MAENKPINIHGLKGVARVTQCGTGVAPYLPVSVLAYVEWFY